jgi:hypothetical protein
LSLIGLRNPLYAQCLALTVVSRTSQPFSWAATAWPGASTTR